MGTPDFAVPALHALAESEYQVVGVVTQPDKPKGRSKAPVYSPVKEEAIKYDIPIYQPARVRSLESVELIKSLKPDMIVVAAFGQIISGEILDIPRFGCINIHGSLLPKYRGAAPIQMAVIDGEKESGVTIMRMSTGIDTGDMISRSVVPISPDETGGSLFDKLAIIGAETLLETIPHIIDGSALYEPQPEESPTPYVNMLKKEMGELDFNKAADRLECLVRGLNPWPCAYTYIGDKNLKIWASRVSDTGPDLGDALPGTVIKTDKSGIHVSCAKGVLILTEVQLAGKKRMNADAFLRGFTLKEGTRLGR